MTKLSQSQIDELYEFITELTDTQEYVFFRLAWVGSEKKDFVSLENKYEIMQKIKKGEIKL